MLLIVEPAYFVEFPDLAQWHASLWQVASKLDEPVDVPDSNVVADSLRVVLFSHRDSSRFERSLLAS